MRFTTANYGEHLRLVVIASQIKTCATLVWEKVILIYYFSCFNALFACPLPSYSFLWYVAPDPPAMLPSPPLTAWNTRRPLDKQRVQLVAPLVISPLSGPSVLRQSLNDVCIPGRTTRGSRLSREEELVSTQHNNTQRRVMI